MAARQNLSDSVKRSPVLTYHTADNEPIPKIRTAVFENIVVGL